MSRKLALLAAGAVFCSPSLGLAGSYPDLSVLAYAEVVPDKELAGMRGRFVRVGQIAYFGIQISTNWQTGSGVVAVVKLNFGVDRPAAVVQAKEGDVGASVSFFYFDPASTAPSVEVQDDDILPSHLSAEITPSPAATPTAPFAGGLEATSGVAQSIQIAGDDNGSLNDLRIYIGPDETGEPLSGPAGPVGVPRELTETTTVSFADGTTGTALLDKNQLGVIVAVDGAGIAKQGIFSGEMNRLGQHISLTSDFTQITQQMLVNFRLDPGLKITRINAALSAARGL